MATDLRRTIGREEFDYPALMAALSDYANPRDKVTALLRRGEIIRVKKGLYVFGDDFRQRPYSPHLLANLIYGPSFISLDSALSFHGLIPERVGSMTSVTTKRPRTFTTPAGVFLYRQTPIDSFYLGIDRFEEGDVAFLIASPERALADKIREDRGNQLRSQKEVALYVFEDLRIDPSEFRRLDLNLIAELAEALGSRKVVLCSRLLRNSGGGE
jgi:hypothetical protein